MSRVFAFALLVAGLMTAGIAYAWSGSYKSSSDMSDLGKTSQVKAAIISTSGDSVRIFSPDNKVLCKGDLIPVFRSTEKTPMEKEQLPGDMSSVISSADLSKMDLVGEVRVENLVGDNYADGKLIVGEAGHGDIATKPSAQCLATGLTPQG